MVSMKKISQKHLTCFIADGWYLFDKACLYSKPILSPLLYTRVSGFKACHDMLFEFDMNITDNGCVSHQMSRKRTL